MILIIGYKLINVTKTFLPPFEEYITILKRAWDKGWITNRGELVKELEEKLKAYLGVKHLLFCNNGTIALQIALKALNITGEVITTPFSYVATTGVILWENCTPVFVDIDENSFCIDASKIEGAITGKTSAILATHVFGHPCDMDTIQTIADKYNLKVIYDGAHAFGTQYKGNSVFNYGNVSTCSFHATKLFHTAEGGCIITNDYSLMEQMTLHHQFGHMADDHFCMGINGKSSELHAAMGLCNFNYIGGISKTRKEQWLYYQTLFKDSGLQLLKIKDENEFNYAYFPVVFKTEELLLETTALLKEKEIMPRRYFYPSLNTLPYIKYTPSPVSEGIAKKVLCLPLYHQLDKKDQLMIAEIVLQCEKQLAE
ncbi:MAG TPA: DegT/DnrJ/EryC1/StrS family aminotransferase [Parafilimonas sp.]|nr:DegT/DnrJ/EryC1/StrS family aminotransferase [Parafilimonas sp.]